MNLRNAIAERWAAVPAIGRVHAYERYGRDNAAMRALYEIDGQIRGWCVTRLAVREISSVVGLATEVATWRISGYLSLSDDAATEIALEDLIEAGRDAFRADETLGGLVFDTSDVAASMPNESGLQVESIDHVMFAGVLCHRARLRLVTSRHISY